MLAVESNFNRGSNLLSAFREHVTDNVKIAPIRFPQRNFVNANLRYRIINFITLKIYSGCVKQHKGNAALKFYVTDVSSLQAQPSLKLVIGNKRINMYSSAICHVTFAK